VPANAPAAAFWSLTVYDVATRALIANKQKIADKSSRMDLIKNDDGSVDIYIGPDAGKGGQLDSHGTGQGMVWLFPLLLADGSLFPPCRTSRKRRDHSDRISRGRLMSAVGT
jgi:hypothetical protein